MFCSQIDTNLASIPWTTSNISIMELGEDVYDMQVDFQERKT